MFFVYIDKQRFCIKNLLLRLLLMKKVILLAACCVAFAFAGSHSSRLPQKVNRHSISHNMEVSLYKMAVELDSKCPFKPIHKKAKVNRDSTAKLEERFDLIRNGIDPDYNLVLENVTLDGSRFIFTFMYPRAITGRDSANLEKGAVIGLNILAGGEATYGKNRNPFTKENVSAILRSDVDLVFRFVGTDDRSVDVLIPKNHFPIPYEDDGNKRVRMVRGVYAVKIGNQIWMEKNMNKETSGSICYEDNPDNCDKYGRLYPIEEARMVCPVGWHLPDSVEFNRLIDFVKATNNLRSRNYDEWGRGREGTDLFGFNAHASGKNNLDGSFTGGYVPAENYTIELLEEDSFCNSYDEGPAAYYWTSDRSPKQVLADEVIEGYFYAFYAHKSCVGKDARFHSTVDESRRSPNEEGRMRLSVRCIKNQ